MDAFSASYRGLSEADGFNALVMGADLGWRDVSLLRAIGRYLRQVGVTYSQTYIAQALAANVDLARLLVSLVPDPVRPRAAAGPRARAARAAELVGEVKTGLNDVASLDHDRIIRWFLAVFQAVVRTNFYASGRQAIALKLLPRQIPDLPAPRPRVRDLRLLARGWRACICGSDRWPAAGCAGRTAPRTSAPRSSAWSRRRWSRTP